MTTKTEAKTNGDTPTNSNAALPKGWPGHVQTSMLNAISMARYSIVNARGWSANSPSAVVRLKAENDRQKEEIALLREEMRIKDARTARIDPHHRPQYPPCERMAILALKTARCWSLEATARTMNVSFGNGRLVAARRARRNGNQAARATAGASQQVSPIRQTYRVVRLKTLCPTMGKVKIAQTLARAGLHLGATTVGRMLKEGGGQTATQRSPATHDDPSTATDNAPTPDA